MLLKDHKERLERARIAQMRWFTESINLNVWSGVVVSPS